MFPYIIRLISSRFTRVQRLTCLVTLIFSWMAVNAAWFRVAPNDEVDIYIGFKGYSFEELIIGAITALIVFPLNLLFLLLFRKSRQKQVVLCKKCLSRSLSPSCFFSFIKQCWIVVKPFIHLERGSVLVPTHLHTESWTVHCFITIVACLLRQGTHFIIFDIPRFFQKDLLI